ncbi:hypothetical protein CW304_31855 [Bacillus sp. UFRGS-B20]|nr:hypothetical protein CW304_31855 [Bacillus sp. UFRGS-B20]
MDLLKQLRNHKPALCNESGIHFGLTCFLNSWSCAFWHGLIVSPVRQQLVIQIVPKFPNSNT